MYAGLSIQLHNLPDDTDLDEVVRILREQIAEFVYWQKGLRYAGDIVVDVEETTGGQETAPI